jgi:hypothetical protein
VAVSIEAAFVLLDKASGPLREIRREAERTDKALRGMGKGGAMGDASKQIQKTTQILDQHGNVLSTVEQKTKSATAATEKTAEATKKLGKEGERTIGFFRNVKAHVENFTRSLLKAHPAITTFSQGLGGVVGGLKGFATALPMFGTLILTALPAVVQLTGALGGLAASLAGAVGGGAILGGGLLGAFGVGIGSVVAIAKPAITSLTNYQKAVTSLNKAIASGRPGQIKAAQRQVDQLAKANPGVAALARNIAGFKKEWDKATAPGRASFLKLANEGVQTLRKNIGWLAPEVDKNMAAVQRSFQKYLAPFLDSRQFQGLVEGLGKIFRTNLPGLMKGVVSIFRGLSNILKVITPDLDKAGGAFKRLADRFDQWTGSARGQRTIRNMTSAFKEWSRLLGGIARIIGDVIGAGMSTGTSVIAKWADSVNKVADRLAKPGGTKGIEDWFKRTMDQAGKLYPILKNVATSLAQIYDVFKPLGSVTTFVLKNLPPAAITALTVGIVGAKTISGVAGGARSVGKAFGKFKDRGDTPMEPLFVSVVGGGLDDSGGGGGLFGRSAKTAEKEGAQAAEKGFFGRTAARFGGTKFGGLLGMGEEGASLLSKVKGLPLIGKLLGGGATAGAGAEGLGLGARLAGGVGSMGLSLLAPAAMGLAGSVLPKSIGRSKGFGIATGAVSGAAMGGAIGSVIPGVGTVIGAGVGGALGAAQSAGLLKPAKLKSLAVAGFKGVKSAAGDAWGWIKKHWDWISIITGPLGMVVTMVIKHFGQITRFIGSLPGKIGRLLSKVPGAVGSALSSVWNVLTFPFRKAAGWIGGLPSRVGRLLSSLGRVVGSAVSNVANALSSPFKSAWRWISGLPDRLKRWVVDPIKSLFSGRLFQDLGNAIAKPFIWAFDFVKKHLPKIGFKSHKILGVSVDLPSIHFAHGGAVPRTTDVLVGEAGPEVLHLPAGSRVTPMTGGFAPPEFAMQTGHPVPTGAPGAAAVGGATAAGAGATANFQKTLMATQRAMNQLLQASKAFTSNFTNPRSGVIGAMNRATASFLDFAQSSRRNIIGSLNRASSAFADFGRDVRRTMNGVDREFDQTAKNARQDLTQIVTDSRWMRDQLLKIMIEQCKQATDGLSANFDQADKNIKQSWTNIVFNTQWGINQIFTKLANAFKTMGVPPPKGIGGGGAKKGAKGMRIPGEPKGDHVPLYDRGGGLMGIADGGELVVNRHTEARVDQKLARFNTTLGREVAGETTPHAAKHETGGRLGAPGFQAGGRLSGSAIVRPVASVLMGGGFSKIAAAGIIGNAYQESTWNPSAMEPGTNNGGLWGFTAGELSLPTLQAWAASRHASWTDPRIQAQFLLSRSQTRSVMGAMNATRSPGAAAMTWMTDWERPGIPAAGNRVRGAQMAWALMNGLKGGGSFGGIAPTIKAPKLKGPPGAITSLGQGAIDLITKGANKKIAESAPADVGGAGGAMGPPMVGPKAVQAMIREANQIASHHYNYEWGGGHGQIGVPGHGTGHGSGPGVGYDCSGSVSAVLNAANLLGTPLTSGSLAGWGDGGPGSHVTIYANPTHTYMTIDGHAFGTSGANPGGGAGWFAGGARPGFAVRHPPGLAMGGRTTRRGDPNGKKGVGLSGQQVQELHPTDQKRLLADPTAVLPGMAVGGRIPWFAQGADFIARRPQVIGVGDAPGGERVTVTPQRSNPTTSRPVHIEIHKIEVHRKGDIKKIVDEELQALAHSLEAQL